MMVPILVKTVKQTNLTVTKPIIDGCMRRHICLVTSMALDAQRKV
jgi:hypothetical protein